MRCHNSGTTIRMYGGWDMTEASLPIQWRAGKSCVLSQWTTCTSPGNVWHDGWNSTRECMSIDVGDPGQGVPGRPVYAAGYNPSPVAAYIWARQAQRCIAYLTTTNDDSPPSFSGGAADPLVRLVHIDFSVANPRSIGSSWKLLQQIDPYNGFAIYLSVTSVVSGGTDECDNESDGAHLHGCA